MRSPANPEVLLPYLPPPHAHLEALLNGLSGAQRPIVAYLPASVGGGPTCPQRARKSRSKPGHHPAPVDLPEGGEYESWRPARLRSGERVERWEAGR